LGASMLTVKPDMLNCACASIEFMSLIRGA
jgi:hypothetical protein